MITDDYIVLFMIGYAVNIISVVVAITEILSKYGIQEPSTYRAEQKTSNKSWRVFIPFYFAYVIIFIVAALLTPPDVFTQTLMAVPLIILFEISIWVSKFAYKKTG